MPDPARILFAPADGRHHVPTVPMPPETVIVDPDLGMIYRIEGTTLSLMVRARHRAGNNTPKENTP